MTTPENSVKAKIRQWLAGFGDAVCYITPVPGTVRHHDGVTRISLYRFADYS